MYGGDTNKYLNGSYTASDSVIYNGNSGILYIGYGLSSNIYIWSTYSPSGCTHFSSTFSESNVTSAISRTVRFSSTPISSLKNRFGQTTVSSRAYRQFTFNDTGVSYWAIYDSSGGVDCSIISQSSTECIVQARVSQVGLTGYFEVASYYTTGYSYYMSYF